MMLNCGRQLSRAATRLLIFRALGSSAEPPGPPARCAHQCFLAVDVVDVASSLCCFTAHLKSNFKKTLKFAFYLIFLQSKHKINWNKSLAKNIKQEMHVKMMYNITTFILEHKNQYQTATLTMKTIITFAPT